MQGSADERNRRSIYGTICYLAGLGIAVLTNMTGWDWVWTAVIIVLAEIALCSYRIMKEHKEGISYYSFSLGPEDGEVFLDALEQARMPRRPDHEPTD